MVDRRANAEGLLLATDLPGPADAVHWIAFNPGGTRLAAGCDNLGHVFVFDPRSGHEVARLPDLSGVMGLQFLSAEVLLVGESKSCLRWDLRRGSIEELWRPDQWGVTGAAASPDGRIAAIGWNEGVIVFEVARRRVLHRLTSLPGFGSGRAIVFSGGGRYVAASLAKDKEDLIAVWDARNGKRQRTYEAFQFARPLAFREDTLTLAVDGGGGELLLYREDEGEDPAASYPLENYPRAVQFRNRGRTLAVLQDGGDVTFVETKLGQGKRRVAAPPKPVLGYATPSVDWSTFAAATEGGVFVWAAGRAEQVAVDAKRKPAAEGG